MAPTVSKQDIASLQNHVDSVRNICILAHVDHGKTTLSDCLISSNGIISERQAGSLCYLDSREDEQERGITMEASAISLLFEHERLNRKFLINLIDSPGHVDFSADVSTAVRLCDGAIVVVDVIEGVAIQTHAVLRQAWEERLQPCLVLNKIDRLITELQLSPTEAYHYLRTIIERVNSILMGFMSASVMQKANVRPDGNRQFSEKSGEAVGDYRSDVPPKPANNSEDDWMLQYDEAAEEALYFSPEKGNVVFASAVDNWAFRVIDFVPILARKLEQPRRWLLHCLWGNYFFSAKDKKIVAPKQTKASSSSGDSSNSRQPLFSKYILESIWQIYGATVIENRPKRLAKIIATVGIENKVNQRDITRGGKLALRTVMKSWLPLTNAVLSTVIRCVPSPIDAQKRRIESLWPESVFLKSPETLVPVLKAARDSVSSCDPKGPIVAFITKIVAVEEKFLSPSTINALLKHEEHDSGLIDEATGIKKDERKEFFVGFARIFSGTLTPDTPLYVLGPKFVPGGSNCDQHCAELKMGALPLLIMGTELHPLDAVPAGNIMAIAGLRNTVLKTATVADTKLCCPLNKMPMQSAPILRVSVEPANPMEWSQLERGLRLLNRADPVVQIRVLSNGEHVLGAIGELHLERCVYDLENRFANISLKVSAPIAVFCETVIEGSIETNQALSMATLSPLYRFPPIDLPKEFEDQNRAKAEEASAMSAIEEGTQLATPLDIPKLVPISKRIFSGGRVIAMVPDSSLAITLRVIPLPLCITRAIENSRPLLEKAMDILKNIEVADSQDVDDRSEGGLSLTITRRLSRRKSSLMALTEANLDHETALNNKESEPEDEEIFSRTDRLLEEARTSILNAFIDAGSSWGSEALDRIWTLGPRGIGPNILFNAIPEECVLSKHSQCVFSPLQTDLSADFSSDLDADQRSFFEYIATGVLAGFQLACRAGPVMEEPLWGVGVVCESVYVDSSTRRSQNFDRGAVTAGSVMSTVRDAIRRGIAAHHLQHEHGEQTGCEVRIVEGMLHSVIHCHVDSHQGDQLGKLYGVLSKRRAKVLEEDILEGTSIFTVEALIPVAESFNLAEDLRRQTSGAASAPQLKFSHWEIVSDNPYFRATTADELEEFGSSGYEDSHLAGNIAHRYIEQVRSRKGLVTNEKLVVDAEKQRTLSRKK